MLPPSAAGLFWGDYNSREKPAPGRPRDQKRNLMELRPGKASAKADIQGTSGTNRLTPDRSPAVVDVVVPADAPGALTSSDSDDL
jgi:hypothetical protein